LRLRDECCRQPVDARVVVTGHEVETFAEPSDSVEHLTADHETEAGGPAQVVGPKAGKLRSSAETEPGERTEGRRREAKLHHWGVEAGGVSKPLELVDFGHGGVAIRGGGLRTHGDGENRSPRLAHLAGVVEAVGGLSLQRSCEKGDEAVADRRVEQFCVELWGLVGKVERVGPAVTPNRASTGRHLVQGGGGGVPVGGGVPPTAGTLGEEGVEVTGCAGLEACVGSTGEREVEQHQVQRAVATARADTEIVGFEVAVGNALALEYADDLEEVVAEAVEEVETESTLDGKPVRKREALTVVGVTGGSEPKGGAAADPFDSEQLDDPDVAEGAQCPSLVTQAFGVLFILGHLEHLGHCRARAGAEERDRGRAAPEPANHPPAAFEKIALVGGKRVGGGHTGRFVTRSGLVVSVGLGWFGNLGGRGGEGLKGIVEQVEQLADGGAVSRDWVCGHCHEGVEVFGQTVDGGSETEALVLGHQALTLHEIGGRWSPGE
jgi:hypothetical protein